jgi:hypothetical protein
MTVPEQFREIIAEALTAALDGRPAEEMESFIKAGGIGQTLDESIPDVSLSFADSLVEAMPEMIAHRRGFQATMTEQVRHTYGTMLSGSSMLWIATPAHAVALSLCVTMRDDEQSPPVGREPGCRVRDGSHERHRRASCRYGRHR